MKRALTIAGSDSGGGAGIQADLKTFCAFGVYGMSAITAITAQNTRSVQAVFPLPEDLVAQQIEAVVRDIGVDAVKTGMLHNARIIGVVAQAVRELGISNLVVDPVMVAKSGAVLLEKKALETLVNELLPLALVVTPNIEEASLLAGFPVKNVEDMEKAAQCIFEKGPRYVVVKGGHLSGEELVDVLFDGQNLAYYRGKRVFTRNTHGTGCTYSAALCALLALGKTVEEALPIVKEYMEVVIQHALPLGGGFGPTNHLAPLFLKMGLAPSEGGKGW
ncbi:MAG: bifunctional hydroxymethylpyrimidine kinase/phosphomethylpyrimidine kinase [Candidatus Caldatribacteriaceae bacterium]